MSKSAKKNKMVIVADAKIFMTWKCTTEGCDCEGQEAIVYPDFYQDNGTPICEGGEDMEYIHTEVEL
jgi:hypothetical protein